jgi:CspA family cold shock protein
MQHGTVKFFRADKGYGFITRDDGRDIFVHINDCDEGLDLLIKGQRVEFEEGSNRRTGKAGSAPPSEPAKSALGLFHPALAQGRGLKTALTSVP